MDPSIRTSSCCTSILPDQVFVDAPGGADVGLHCVLVLAQFTAQAQVLEEAEQKLLPLRLPHRIVIL